MACTLPPSVSLISCNRRPSGSTAGHVPDRAAKSFASGSTACMASATAARRSSGGQPLPSWTYFRLVTLAPTPPRRPASRRVEAGDRLDARRAAELDELHDPPAARLERIPARVVLRAAIRVAEHRLPLVAGRAGVIAAQPDAGHARIDDRLGEVGPHGQALEQPLAGRHQHDLVHPDRAGPVDPYGEAGFVVRGVGL